MRIIALLLIALNSVLALWYYWRPQDNDQEITHMPVSIPVIKLVKESPAEISNIGNQQEFEEKNDVEKQVETFECFTLGPFRDVETVVKVKSELSGLTKNQSQRNIEEKEFYRYWVYMPIKDGRVEAIERSKALAAENLKDYYIIQTGENANQISLGHFREKKNAEERTAQLKKLGFNVAFKAVYKDVQLSWIDYESNKEAEAAISEVIAPYLEEDVARLVRECTNP